MAQAAIVSNMITQKLRKTDNSPFTETEIITFTTSGDKFVDRPLADIGGKGLFTKELEEAMLANKIDIAVHSMKDMATKLPNGLIVPAVLEREDPRDCLISKEYRSLGQIPEGAVFGTSSLRRQVQVQSIRPDLQIIPFRGNVNTRLAKIDQGIAAASMLAVAGLKRLGLEEHIAYTFGIDEILPAVAQGIIAIQCRESDADIISILELLNHQPSFMQAQAERAMLEVLDGSCRTPIAGFAEISGSTLLLRGMIAPLTGGACVFAELAGNIQDAVQIGRELGEELRVLTAE